jgi:hypothetical protein
MANPRISDVHIDRAIANVAIRYTNDMMVAENVAPRVTVQNESDKYFKFDKGDWMRDEADNDRQPGTRAPRGGYRLSTDTYTLKEIAQASEVPDRIRDNADNPLRPFEDASEWASRMVMIRREKRAASALFASSTWGTDQTVSSKWGDFVNSDPANDVAVGVDSILSSTGQMPNSLLVGQEVYSKLRQHPDGLDRYKHTQTGIMNEEMVAQWLGVDNIIVGRAINNTAAEGATDSMSFIWGKNALLMYTTASPSISEPSAAYIFQKGGVDTKRFREEAEAQDVVEVTHLVDIKVTASDCGYYFPSVVA